MAGLIRVNRYVLLPPGVDRVLDRKDL